MKETVAVLMSGGVDSSIASWLLKKEGYNVIGLTLKLLSSKDSLGLNQMCCSVANIEDAERVASHLSFPHYVIELHNEFEKEVIENFCQEYISGRTPNPCIECNRRIKFGIALQKIKSMFNVNYISSGHYARISRINGKYFIKTAFDAEKDQSYFLYSLTPEILKYVKFPLGEFKKSEVRKIADELNLHVAEKRESQQICFIPHGDYKDFLRSRGFHDGFKTGEIVDIRTGQVLGYHTGYACYTIGQKKGIGISKGERYYVVKIDKEDNKIYVGKEEELYSDILVADNINMYIDETDFPIKNVYARIRYKHIPALCDVSLVNDKMKVKFHSPQKAITPGQHVVIYDNDGRILCGGRIIGS